MRTATRNIESYLCAFFTKRGFSAPPKNFKSKAANSFKKKWAAKPYSFLTNHINQLLWSFAIQGKGADLDQTALLMDLEYLVEMIISMPPPGGLYGKSLNSKKERGKNVYSKRMQINKMKKVLELIGDLKFNKDDKNWLGDQWIQEIGALEKNINQLIMKAELIHQEYKKRVFEGTNSAKRLIIAFGGKRIIFAD
ncbi:MAG: hypothetical protein ACK5W9_06010, partial [Bdellovibrionales bacterium]